MDVFFIHVLQQQKSMPGDLFHSGKFNRQRIDFMGQCFKKIFSRILTAVILLTLGLPCRAANAEFSDVPANSWYADAVTFCRENGLMSGVESGRFAPNGTASRAMLAAVLYRRAGSPATAAAAGFSDVPLNAYYKNAVDWGFSTGLIAGYGNERFGPADPVTREQLAAFLCPAAGRKTLRTRRRFQAMRYLP